MTVNLTYDATLSRIRAAVSAAPSNTDLVLLERSTDQIRWTTVRGATAVPLVAGAATVDDYEFSPDVLNYYRVSYVDVGGHTDVNIGTAASGDNTSLAPGLPAGMQPGDLMVMFAAIRNSGTGTVNTPTGWAKVLQSGNVALFTRRFVAGDTAPTVTFSGGVAGATTQAQIYARRNAYEVPAGTAQQLNGSAQNIGLPGITVPSSTGGILGVAVGWKQDDWTDATVPGGHTEMGDLPTLTGDDQGVVWTRFFPGAGVRAPETITITGGAAAISRGLIALFPTPPFYLRETASITPALDSVWIKSIARPFLNRPVTVTDFSPVRRRARAGVFDVSGRSDPVAVNDLRASRQFDLQVVTQNLGEAADFDLVLASGDPLFVHVPADCPVPGGYVTVGDTDEARAARRSVRRVFTLPCTVVAAPGPEVVGVTYTYAGVANDWATYADMIAANATYADLTEHIGDAEDVVVE